MSRVRAATTLATGMAYRASRAPWLASSLIARSAADDEDTATIAKMMLTRPQAVPHLESAVTDGRADLVEVLVSIGTPGARDALSRLAADADPAVARAAEEGLQLLDRERRDR